MKPYTEAQKLLIFMGADPLIILTVLSRQRQPSYTKRGPGRFHKQGKGKAK